MMNRDECPRLISVIVPVRNGGERFVEQLAALSEQDYEGDWELIIVDNGSTDGSGELVEVWSDQLPVRVIDARQRAGINYARNEGVRAATGDFLAFCDADDVADVGWLRAMAKAAEFSELVGGRIDTTSLNSSEVANWRWEKSGDGLPVALDFLVYATGANLGIWRRVFEFLGGWDERYAGGGDDVDLSWRAQLAKFRLTYEPNAVMQYRFRSDLRSLARQVYRYGRSDPLLYRNFRGSGLARASLRDAARCWMGLVRNWRELLRDDVGARGRWVRIAAYRWGRAVGSIRHRAIYL